MVNQTRQEQIQELKKVYVDLLELWRVEFQKKAKRRSSKFTI